MKKLFSALTIICLSVFHTNAQDTKNTIKLNVLSLIFTNISIQDEYTINGNSSVCLGVSYLPERKFLTSPLQQEAKDKVKDVLINGFSITPEYRYYFKGNGPKGLYLAGYMRYAKYTTPESDYHYKRSNGENQTVKVSGDYTSIGVGVMLGSQWLLSDKFTLDWWILGASFGSAEGNYTGKGTFTEQDQQDIKDSVEGVNIVGVKASVTTSATQVDVKVDNHLPAIRGFGLCFGYRF